MKKVYSLVGVGIACLAAYVYAADNVAPSSGIVRDVSVVRWNLAAVGFTSSAGGTSTTNVLQTTPGIVGRIVWNPVGTNDVLKVFSCQTAATAAAGNQILELHPNLVQNSLTATYNIDLGAGISATNGITVVTTRDNTNGNARAFINYDGTL